MATASFAGSGVALVSNMVFDQVGGNWVAGSPARRSAGAKPVGDMGGVHPATAARRHSVRRHHQGRHQQLLRRKRTVTFTRTGDADTDQSSRPRRPAAPGGFPGTALHGRYHEAITFTNGNFAPGQDDLSVDTNVCAPAIGA